MLSLPKLLGCHLENIPHQVPYITPLQTIPVAMAISSALTWKIGLAWQGNPANLRDVQRSIPLSQYKALFDLPGCSFFSLQHVSFIPDWRWLRDRTDSPWYPTMRLFRQSCHGDWSSVITQVFASLRELSQI